MGRSSGRPRAMRRRTRNFFGSCANSFVPPKSSGQHFSQTRDGYLFSVVLSLWHDVHGLGILYLSVIAGVMNANVCALTKTPGIVTSIFGMWQATHSLPVEPSL